MTPTSPAAPAGRSGETGSEAQRNLWRRAMEHSVVRTAFGLAVLGAIVGGLVVFDQLTGGGDSEVGALDASRPEVGQPAPLFALADPEGKIHELSSFRGRVVWVNFWATWCGPCRRELPDIQRLAEEFKDRGLVVLAVNQGQSAGEAEAFWEELDLDLPILLDSDAEVSAQYRLRGLPDSFFIDREGVLRAFDQGLLTEEEMREGLAEASLE